MANATNNSLALQWRQAISAYQGGNLAEAERLCRRVVGAKRDFFEGVHLLAVVEAALGRREDALATFRRALALRPRDADALNHRGIVLAELGRTAEALASFDGALAARPDHWQALHNRAAMLSRLGRREEALTAIDGMLSRRPSAADALLSRGNLLKEMGRLEEALQCYGRVLAREGKNADALFNQGSVLHQLGRLGEALESYERGLAARPDDAAALHLRGKALDEMGRHEEALASFERALRQQRDHPDLLNDRGVALHALHRYEDALASFERALGARPDHVEALHNRANALQALKRYDEALASYDRVVAARPDHALAARNRGTLLYLMGRHDEALASYDRALAARPDLAEAWSERGVVLNELRRHEEARESCERALRLRPDLVPALVNRGNALRQLGRQEEALADFERATMLRPDHIVALNSSGSMLRALDRFEDALASYERVRALAPDNTEALSGAAYCAANLCRWEGWDDRAASLAAAVAGGQAIEPIVFMGYSGDPALQRQCAQNYVARRVPSPPPALWRGETWRHDRLRIAYLSSDFSFARRGAGDFQRHDRSRFEIIGVSYGIDDPPLVAAFDRFHRVGGHSDEAIARLLRSLECDIVVDRQGHAGPARPGILAYRPAPIQATYLAYPGTIGAPFIDYIIADRIVAPFESQPFFAERIVQLPDCYQVNDASRGIADVTPSRQETGLPADGFVFCCFNNDWKIVPAIFDIWMHLLGAVEGSVLWLLRSTDGADRNLRREAARRGIDPARLVFAERQPLAEHLARHRLADLFLDTLPYNAHTTASDALWAGVPVVTCAGQAFRLPGRRQHAARSAVGGADRAGSRHLRGAGHRPRPQSRPRRGTEGAASARRRDVPLVRCRALHPPP